MSVWLDRLVFCSLFQVCEAPGYHRAWKKGICWNGWLPNCPEMVSPYHMFAEEEEEKKKKKKTHSCWKAVFGTAVRNDGFVFAISLSWHHAPGLWEIGIYTDGTYRIRSLTITHKGTSFFFCFFSIIFRGTRTNVSLRVFFKPSYSSASPLPLTACCRAKSVGSGGNFCHYDTCPMWPS
jgi:hypothetical protein